MTRYHLDSQGNPCLVYAFTGAPGAGLPIDPSAPRPCSLPHPVSALTCPDSLTGWMEGTLLFTAFIPRIISRLTWFCQQKCFLGFRATPHNGARAFDERFCPRRKFGKCGNTGCISHFSNCAGGAKDPSKAAAPIVRCCPRQISVWRAVSVYGLSDKL